MDRSKVAPGQTHRIGTEWHSLDWGSPYPALVLNPATSLHANSESFGIFSFRAVNRLRGFAETQPMAPAHIILQEVMQARCEPLRHLVESRFRIHINTQNPSATVLPHPSNPHGGSTVALTCASLLDMLEAEMPRGSFQWTPKRAKTTQDHQQPQSRGDTPHATPPKFDLGDFGNTLAKGLLQEMANFRPQVLKVSYSMFTLARRRTSMTLTLTKRYYRNGLRLSESSSFTCWSWTIWRISRAR